MRILLSISFIAMIKAFSYLDTVPKNINELFPMAKNSNVSLNKTAAFDIQKIDVAKLVKKLGSMNNSGLAMLADTRKHGIPADYTKLDTYPYRDAYAQASDTISKQKICDLMLQVIYMARHGIRRLESSQYFNKHDIGYRLGILFNRLRLINRKMRDIYQTMTNTEDIEYFAAGEKGEVNRNLEREDRYLIMHHRMVKMHTDFTYLFWVTIKIDGMFTDLNELRIKLPRNMTTDGISIESREIG